MLKDPLRGQATTHPSGAAGLGHRRSLRMTWCLGMVAFTGLGTSDCKTEPLYMPIQVLIEGIAVDFRWPPANPRLQMGAPRPCRCTCPSRLNLVSFPSMLPVRQGAATFTGCPLATGRGVKTRWFCVTSNLPLSLTRAAESARQCVHLAPKYATIRIAFCKLVVWTSLASRSEAPIMQCLRRVLSRRLRAFRIVYSSMIVRNERPPFRLSCS